MNPKTRFAAVFLSALTLGWSQAPSPAVLQQVLEKRLLSLRPDGMTERQVLFEEVRAGAKVGNAYPFTVTGSIRDYGPGYPANNFYGQTCVGRIPGWVFQLSRNATGDWQVDGRMTVTDSRCEKNPAAGVSSIPLASLKGAAAPAQPVPGAERATGPTELHLGEWACYGTGGRLMAGLGFILQADGTYLNGDKKPGGRWIREVAAARISFRGGHLDGQTGSKLTGQGMTLSNTVSCEPWR
jgi:hypothetical protein